jgi:hypothetical protein
MRQQAEEIEHSASGAAAWSDPVDTRPEYRVTIRSRPAIEARCVKITILVLAALLPGAAALAQVDAGDADFTRFYALGDSLMSGESSTSLVQTFQVRSVPALIYRQVNGTDEGFEAPWISEAGIPIRLVLGTTALDELYLQAQEGVPLNDDYDGTFTNMGISGGARVFDLLAVGSYDDCAAINDALENLGLPPW